MKRAFTLIEILVAISIVLVLAAICFPVFASVKKSANRASCVSNLHQIGMAIALYREKWDGAEQGTPSQMGLPTELVFLPHDMQGRPLYECHGNNPHGNSYSNNWPLQVRFESPSELENIEKWYRRWAAYVAEVGPAAILMYDENHQASFPRSFSWENWTAIGLRLDQSVIIRTHLGMPWFYRWWHD